MNAPTNPAKNHPSRTPRRTPAKKPKLPHWKRPPCVPLTLSRPFIATPEFPASAPSSRRAALIAPQSTAPAPEYPSHFAHTRCPAALRSSKASCALDSPRVSSVGPERSCSGVGGESGYNNRRSARGCRGTGGARAHPRIHAPTRIRSTETHDAAASALAGDADHR